MTERIREPAHASCESLAGPSFARGDQLHPGPQPADQEPLRRSLLTRLSDDFMGQLGKTLRNRGTSLQPRATGMLPPSPVRANQSGPHSAAPVHAVSYEPVYSERHLFINDRRRRATAFVLSISGGRFHHSIGALVIAPENRIPSSDRIGVVRK